MKSHVLIIADGRSPTALSWIKHVQTLDYRVSLISSFQCEKPAGVDHFHILPIAFSRFSSSNASTKEKRSGSRLNHIVRRFTPLLQNFRYILGPLSLLRYKQPYQQIVEKITPDFVHALRVPFEGMLASYSPRGIPVVVAIWGNDLTLHAKGSWLMRNFTKKSLKRADGLSSDTLRDIRLAKEMGLKPSVPVLDVPGSGGLDLEAIKNVSKFKNHYNIPEDTTWVVNPRGVRPGSIHQDVFFKAIPRVLAQRPNTSFICPSLKGQPQAENWMEEFKTEGHTFLLPKLPQSELWGLFKESKLFVSPSSHDGTPNTLLEAMACGSVPILGDIESMREWVKNGQNGLLVNPLDPEALSQAILNALKEPDFLERAAEINREMIENRAVEKVTLPRIDSFYSLFS